jgi:hypothetical protein
LERYARIANMSKTLQAFISRECADNLTPRVYMITYHSDNNSSESAILQLARCITELVTHYRLGPKYGHHMCDVVTQRTCFVYLRLATDRQDERENWLYIYIFIYLFIYLKLM